LEEVSGPLFECRLRSGFKESTESVADDFDDFFDTL
jgi:hypothetical protein